MMNNSIAAHISEDGRIQTVAEHCKMVAKYAAENGKSINLEATMRIAGLLHDIGKNTDEFNTYIKAAHDKQPLSKGKLNHSSAGAKYLNDCIRVTTAKQSLTLQLISYAIVSHHGLNDCLSLNGDDKYTDRIDPSKDISYEAVVENSKGFIDSNEINSLFSDAVDEIQNVYKKLNMLSKEMLINVSDEENNTEYKNNGWYLLGCLQRIVLSMLMDADRRDTAEFMDNERQYRLQPDETVQLWKNYQRKLDGRLNSFRGTDRISKLRKEMSDQCFSSSCFSDGIYKLSIPTGGGKTYSGFRFALEEAIEKKKEHIIYIAPFLSILEQNAADIKNVFADDFHILEHHSNMLFDNSDNGDYLQQHQLYEEDWSSPVILTTMTRFLEVLFSDGSSNIRRMHQLKNSVIIVDEAQSIPVRCINLFTGMMNFMSYCCNDIVVLCTATQPLFDKVQHSIIYGENKNLIRNPRKYAAEFKRVNVINKTNLGLLDSQQLADFVLNTFNTSMLVILNTKHAVHEIYMAIQPYIENDVELIQLTTLMCAAHRNKKINELKEMLKNGKKVICVSTQLIEAGVDISFDTVIRSAAGLDSISQAAGRCNRNGEMNTLGSVYIINYKEEKTGNLVDIQKGKEAFLNVASRFDGDLLSTKALDMFYKQYYFDRYREMSYSLQEENTNLFELLSTNTGSNNEYKLEKNKPYPYPLSQAYAYAGSHFHAIENTNSIGLIIPYDEAVSYIAELKMERSFTDVKRTLKLLQRYTVNINKNSFLIRELIARHAIDSSVLDGDILILDKDFYSNEVGINSDLNLQVF